MERFMIMCGGHPKSKPSNDISDEQFERLGRLLIRSAKRYGTILLAMSPTLPKDISKAICWLMDNGLEISIEKDRLNTIYIQGKYTLT